MRQQLNAQENVIQGSIEYFMYMESLVDMFVRSYRKLFGVQQEAGRNTVSMRSLAARCTTTCTLPHFARFYNLSMQLCMYMYIYIYKLPISPKTA